MGSLLSFETSIAKNQPLVYAAGAQKGALEKI
jgi:hypothetical protein